ncbi:MAG: hypothetical protein LBK04_00800 [Clostridiales Family XIII bacterium]|nr:hypothetical protein [Clostridiales Family XIII bacterium]
MILAVVAWFASLPAIGLDLFYTAGLALGTLVGILGVTLIKIAVNAAVRTRRRSFTFMTFCLRVFMYAGAIYIGALLSLGGMIGAAVGILLPRVSIGVQQLLLPWIRKRQSAGQPAVEPEYEHEYEPAEKTRVFVRQPWRVTYRNGRKYVTHKRFEKFAKTTKKKAAVYGERR